ncbi:Metallo-dependent phosphatase [Annulohypoxylon bovei var. microspora]|nr:Metallo-dependent phosphatase [Annulohypoxylon bovei var. microspora]
MVNKGPDSGGVVDRAMAIGALGVRGNHEDRVLRAWKKMHGGKRKHGRRAVEGEEGEVEGEDSSSGEEVRGEEDGEEGSDLTPAKLSKSTARDRATAALLTPAQVSWLAKLPVILRVGAVSPYYGDVIVVHAGLVPGIALEEQDPWAAMHMRTLISRSSHSRSAATPDSEPPSLDASRRRTFKPSEGREGRPWAEVWNEAQKQKAKAQKKGKGDEEEQGGGKERRTTVIYGHDAKVGLSIRRYAFGLDSNCVKGGDLTALVFEAASSTFASASGEEDHSDEEEDVSEQAKHGITHRLVSVPCEAPDSDDDKGGKKKKKDKSKHKDKGKGEKKHKDHNK